MAKNIFEEPTFKVITFRLEDVVSCDSNLSGSGTTGGDQGVLDDDNFS